MASRTRKKDQAGARRVAEEQARAEPVAQGRASDDGLQRTQRLQMLGGVVIVALAVAAVAIAVSAGGNSTPNAKPARSGQTCTGSTDSAICSLLSGIPESGNVLGNANAPVTVTEFGDLECSICKELATGGVENDLISKDVRSGKVKLVYRSLETATSGAPNPAIFGLQQAAAYAAGQQDKAWYYIEFFYHYQGPEDTGYVNQTYLNNLAKHVPGLNFSRWLSASHSQALLTEVSTDETAATGKGFSTTPTLLITGPKGQAQPITVLPSSFSQLQSAITSVS